MNEPSTDPVVTDAPDRHRFQLTLDGEPAGELQYLDRDGQRVLVHTEVDERFSGQGLAGTLVRRALDETRDAGRRVVPVCSYVKSFLERHHDWDDLLDPVTPDVLQALDRNNTA